MKAIISSAGKNQIGFGGKPKCLHRINGKSRLFEIFQSCKAVGIDSSEVRLVLGCDDHSNQYIREFLHENDFSPEIVINEHPEKSAVYTFRAAFQNLEHLKEPVIVLRCDEYYHPSVLQQIIAEKNSLVCFSAPPPSKSSEPLSVLPPEDNIFKVSPQLMPYFTDDIYLDANFYSTDQKIFQAHFHRVHHQPIPEGMPSLVRKKNISTGYAMMFMQLHAIDAVKSKFTARYSLLPDHGLYIPDLDSITQTDDFKNTPPFLRPFRYSSFYLIESIVFIKKFIKKFIPAKILYRLGKLE